MVDFINKIEIVQT